MDEKDLKSLIESIDRLNSNIEWQTSLKFVVIQGIVYGISLIIGTTILAGIVISLLRDIPVVDTAIEEFQTEPVLE